MRLLYGQSEQFAEWASRYFGVNLRPCTAIGLVYDNRIVGCVLYNNFNYGKDGEPLCVDVSVLMLEKKPLTKYNIKALFSYPFSDLRVKRLQVRVARKQKRHRKLVERLGFTFEGILRDAYLSGGDTAIYSMLRNEWENGKFTIRAGSGRDGSSAN